MYSYHNYFLEKISILEKLKKKKRKNNILNNYLLPFIIALIMLFIGVNYGDSIKNSFIGKKLYKNQSKKLEK